MKKTHKVSRSYKKKQPTMTLELERYGKITPTFDKNFEAIYVIKYRDKNELIKLKEVTYDKDNVPDKIKVKFTKLDV